VRGKLQRNRERMTVRGLNDNHNRDLKNLFKSAAISASTRPGPLRDFYVARVEKGMRPTMARLTLARKMAAISLTIWKKGCASAPSHPLHAMPPRITRNSDRPRASDRTMVDIVLLAASCTLELDHQQQQRNLTRMGQQAKPLQGNETEWAGSRERTSILPSRRSFFLDIPFYRTSLFIELIEVCSPGSMSERRFIANHRTPWDHPYEGKVRADRPALSETVSRSFADAVR